MKHRGGADGSARSLAALVAAALVSHDVPDADEAEIDAVVAYVDACLADMPDVTRVGVAVASGAAYLALSALGLAPYRCQSPRRQSAAAVRMAAIRLPMLSEFSRLSRGLGLVGVFEQRAHDGGTA